MDKKLENIKHMQDFKIYLDYPRENDSSLFKPMGFNTCTVNPDSMISWTKKDNDLYLIRVSKECVKHIKIPRYGIDLPMMCEDLRFVKSNIKRHTKDGVEFITIEILMPGEFSENELKNTKLTTNEIYQPVNNLTTETSISKNYDNQTGYIDEDDFFEDNFNPIEVSIYIKDKNIDLKTLNAFAEFNHLDEFDLNTKLNEETLYLLDNNLLNDDFNSWLTTKTTYENAKRINAKELIRNLTYGTKIDEKTIIGIEVSESKKKWILNSLQYLIDTEYYNEEERERIKKIIDSNNEISTKIHQLKRYFHRDSKILLRAELDDPYENFHWGGLSGEEANTAYWNCD